MKIEILVEKEDEHLRLDRFSSDKNPEYSRSFVQKAIEQGNITVNGNQSDKKYRLKSGDRVSFDIEKPLEFIPEPRNIPLDIVYEDEDILVVNKPKGMVVHPATSHLDDTLVNALLFHCKKLSDLNGMLRPGIIHRIDKDTSGLLMIAKNNRAHESLSGQLAEHTITRKYTALVYNNFSEDEGTVDAPLGRDPKNRLRRAVVRENSKRAVTHWRVLERFGKYTLIEAQLETGRTHQIRVHMAYINHPLVGDMLYGPKKQPLFQEGQLLHAGVLGFVHPSTGEYMEFCRPLPDEFQQVLEKLRRS